MVPRSEAGQKIVARAEGASQQAAVQAAPERLTRLEKPNRDVKLGLRFGLHPQTKQARHAAVHLAQPHTSHPPSHLTAMTFWPGRGTAEPSRTPTHRCGAGDHLGT